MSTDIRTQAQRVLEIEAQAILSLRDKIGESFEVAVRTIAASQGKLIVTGIGKSGQISRKLASTFTSTGTPSVFLHPAESSHGDLGIIEKGDVVLALSYGGSSPEFNSVINFCARKGNTLIAMTGKDTSILAKGAKIVLDVCVSEEACPLGLAPTASSTAMLALGDALAMAVMNQKGFSAEKFAEFHPGGNLGYRLLTKVKDVMHSGDALPTVNLDTQVKQVLSIMTHKDVRGAAGIVDENGDLVGVITDGDIRRRLEKNSDPLTGVAKDLMTTNPRTIDANELAEKALFLMEKFSIQMVFVLDNSASQPRKPAGILHIQDLLRIKVR